MAAAETPAAAPLPAPSWLGAEMATLAAAHKAGRLPHGLLIHEAPGAGGDCGRGGNSGQLRATASVSIRDQTLARNWGSRDDANRQSPSTWPSLGSLSGSFMIWHGSNRI